MNSLRMTMMLIVGALVLLTIVGVAWSASVPEGTAVAAAERAAAPRISAFDRPFRPTRAQRRARSAISRLQRRVPAAAIAATADIDASRPVEIEGTTAEGWISPAEDGGVCTFIPDPAGGYGASCATAEDLAFGAAITLLGGGSGGPLDDAAIAVVVVPDGAAAPHVIEPDGADDRLVVESNTAAKLVKGGDTVVSGASEIHVPESSVPNCAPPRRGETFRRCS